MSSSTGHLPFSQTSKYCRTLLLVFFVGFFYQLRNMIVEAKSIDEELGGTVPTQGDDHDYQILAVNLLAGKGFASSISLPLNIYHLDLETDFGEQAIAQYQANGPVDPPAYTFYRAPGFPLLLAVAYRIFGIHTLVARLLLVALAWLTAVILLLLGAQLADWLGAICGALVGLYLLTFHPSVNAARILTETPAMFWVALFALCFTIYLRKRQFTTLFLAALTLTCAIYTRSNTVMALPFFLLTIWLSDHRRDAIIFLSIILVPISVWSIYASTTRGQFTAFTTQSEIAFPQFNNRDVLEGVGPDRLLQGLWNPGYYLEDGTLLNDYHNAAQEGENGWVKGLTFWYENNEQLPRLFYVKLRAGFWYDDGKTSYLNGLNGLYLIGVGFLLFSIGLRPAMPKVAGFTTFSSKQAFRVQLALIALLFIFWNHAPFILILAVWFLMTLLALLFPYGDQYQSKFTIPVWVLSFVLGHAVVVMLFGGVPRFHWPLDPILLLCALLGTAILVYELVRTTEFDPDSKLLGTLLFGGGMGILLLFSVFGWLTRFQLVGKAAGLVLVTMGLLMMRGIVMPWQPTTLSKAIIVAGGLLIGVGCAMIFLFITFGPISMSWLPEGVPGVSGATQSAVVMVSGVASIVSGLEILSSQKALLSTIRDRTETGD
jgi:4-amino-4-deoxy-L-arabinose transferase-like glycosyltransferase